MGKVRTKLCVYFGISGKAVNERHIKMRLSCAYEGDENSIARLEVEHEVDAQWQPLNLGITSPGFDIFVYSLFHCQHTYFRINCAERRLLLGSAEGSISVITDEDWNLRDLQVRFSGQLISGVAGQDDIDYIVGRMKQCPASRNIREPDGARTAISLAS